MAGIGLRRVGPAPEQSDLLPATEPKARILVVNTMKFAGDRRTAQGAFSSYIDDLEGG